jgi:hypothetical protein
MANTVTLALSVNNTAYSIAMTDHMANTVTRALEVSAI